MIGTVSPRVKDTEAKILARIYQFVLSWPAPDENQTTDTLDLLGEQGPVVGKETEVQNESEPTPK